MEQINALVEVIFKAWTVISSILTMVGVVSLAFVIIGCISGLTQAITRFGLALFGKKVAVFASVDDFHVIKSDLASSGLVKEKNIERVSVEQQSSLNDALLIVFACRDDNKEHIKEAVARKSSRCGLVVYCPDGPSALTQEEMAEINAAPFATVCNFRGRLINDILLMMLSTSFKKSDLK